MSQRHMILGRIAVLAACFGWFAAIAPVGAQEESSVLVSKQPGPATEGPALTAPANEPVLPPPARPSTNDVRERPAARSAKRPFLRPAEPKRQEAATAGLTSAEETIPDPTSPPAEVRPAPPIKYDTDRGARRMYAESGQVEIIMVTENPADGCLYEIPLCVPACCAGEGPRISSGRGIFGRGVVEYCWPCGFTAKVKFRHILGDVQVEYDS